jgi:thiamine-phosphate diphosphorylase
MSTQVHTTPAGASWAGLHVIVGGASAEETLAVTEAALQGGARIIQVRLKEAPSGLLHRAASAVARAVRSVPGARIVVNDRLDVALAVDADAVHLGQDDLAPGDARTAIAASGRALFWGLSTHDLAQALAAKRAGAAYIGFGPVFVTESKREALPPRGIAQLQAVCRAVDVAVIAIGGITPGNAREALAAGAAGIAVISAITSADDRVAAVRRFTALFERKDPAAGQARRTP